MKHLATTFVLAILAAGLARADFKTGLDAYQRADYATALQEWRPLAEKGDANAQYNLGLLYNQGLGVQQDFKAAADWYRKAAEQGNSNAQYNLGVMGSTGQGVPKDPSQAMKWYLKAAEKGVVGAQNNLGTLYNEGPGGFQDYSQSEKWYRKAAEQGVASAQFNLAVMYDIGQGVPINYAEALNWYHKAADQGHAGALANIGILYYNGQGVKRDLVQALQYFTIARQAGDSRAPELVHAAAEKLRPKDIQRAETLASEWRSAHPSRILAGQTEIAATAVAAQQVDSSAPQPAESSAASQIKTAAAPRIETAGSEVKRQEKSQIRSQESGQIARRDRESTEGVWSNVERVVAVGDVHGDYGQLVAVLQTAKLIDDNGNWTGGKTHLVQTGDVLDRGSESRKCMDLLMRLEQQAAAAGGAVHALIGNHEAMNIYGDLRYVAPAEFAAYRDENSEKVRAEAFHKERPSDDRAHWEAQHPLGYFEHRQQLAASGLYGKWILSHDAAIKINDTLFLHAGISPKYASSKISDINRRVRDELKNSEKLNGGIVTDVDGPLWYRGLAQGDEAQLADHVERVLKNFGVSRIVVGHTYANAAITPRFNGKVSLIDIGLSRVYDNIGKVGCLVMESGATYVLHRGTKLELPSDSGKDMLRYLKEAAALDPAPSPLLKRISELEAKLGAGSN